MKRKATATIPKEITTLRFDDAVKMQRALYDAEIPFLFGMLKFSMRLMFNFQDAADIERAAKLFPDHFIIKNVKDARYGKTYEFKDSGAPETKKS